MQPLPLRIDLFALIMLLGVAQGLFLGIFFLTGSRQNQLANRCLGWLMLAMAAIISEIGLCYSNAIMECLFLIDFSEPIAFAVGPLFYFFVVARLHRRLPRRWLWHLLPALIWTINSITWLYQPVEFHYNSFIHAYHPELPYIATRLYIPHDFTQLRPFVSELTLLSVLIYSSLTLYRWIEAYRQRGYVFWQSAPEPLPTLRTFVLLNLLLPLLIAGVKLRYREDLGDYLLACYITGIIYVMCYMLMRGSPFFQEPVTEQPEQAPTEPKKKYEKSALTNDAEDAVLTRLDQLLLTNKPHLDSTLSLPKLASQLRTSPHHLSQLLNDRLGQTFFDWLATHRVAEAQRMLIDPTTAGLKIDDIAERVGYNATSAFHTAFKRITGQTPAQFRDANRTAAGSSRSARSS